MLETVEDSSMFSKVENISPASKHQSYLDMPLQLTNHNAKPLLSSCGPYGKGKLIEQSNSSESNTEFNINALVTTEGDKLLTTSKDHNLKQTPLATLEYANGGFSER